MEDDSSRYAGFFLLAGIVGPFAVVLLLVLTIPFTRDSQLDAVGDLGFYMILFAGTACFAEGMRRTCFPVLGIVALSLLYLGLEGCVLLYFALTLACALFGECP